MEAFLVEMAGKYTWVMATCLVMGVFRLMFKPTIAFLRAFVSATPTTKDDAVMDKVEANKVTKALVWFADYLLSIKLPGAK